MYRIPLRVTNVDLDDDTTIEIIGQYLPHLSWSEAAGRVVVVLFTDAADPVSATCEAARSIANRLAGAQIEEVDEEVVNIPGIAQRFGVTREAVRHWVDGRRGPGDFPPHFTEVPEGRKGYEKLWRWADVVPWLTENYGYEEDHELLDREQVVRINTALLGVSDSMDVEWTTQFDVFIGDSSPAAPSIDSVLPRHMLRWLMEQEDLPELAALDLPATLDYATESKMSAILHRERVYER